MAGCKMAPRRCAVLLFCGGGLLVFSSGLSCFAKAALPVLVPAARGCDAVTAAAWECQTLEVLQTSDYGLRAAKSSPWTVFFSSKGDKVGERRSRRLQERCQEEGLKCIQLSPEKGSKTQALALEFLMGLRVWEKSDNSDAVIFAEDDTVFISNFGKELHRSLKQLPATWQAFWLCPGFLHSRKVPKPLGQAFQLNPEGKLLSDAKRSPGGRVYLDWPLGATEVNRKGVLAGGPATGVIKKSARPLFRKALKAALAKGEPSNAGNDGVFFLVAKVFGFKVACLTDVLTRAGADVTLASAEESLSLRLSGSLTVEADALLPDCLERDWAAIALPGGKEGAERLAENRPLTSLLRKQRQAVRCIAAIGESPAEVLAGNDLLEFDEHRISQCARAGGAEN
eukprot:s4513_g3.t1